MRAAVFRKVNTPFEIEEVTLDKPRGREVLIRTKASGICHSDYHFYKGLYPYPAPTILGHEAAGVVEAVGEGVSYVKPGDHVITCISAFCGHCEFCLEGRMSLCQEPELQRGRRRAAPHIAKRRTHIPVPESLGLRRTDAGA